MNPPSEVRIIGVAGGSGSGKTTFARELLQLLGHERSAILAQDAYYIDQSARFTGDGESVNFDHPSALDFTLLAEHLALLKMGQPVEVPQYDFVTHQRRTSTTRQDPRPVILVDGTLILSQELILSHLDHSIFIETPEAIRFERRLRRDVRERGREPEGVRKQFERQVKPMHDQFVEPSKAFAREILPGTKSFEIELNRLVQWLTSQKR